MLPSLRASVTLALRCGCVVPSVVKDVRFASSPDAGRGTGSSQAGGAGAPTYDDHQEPILHRTVPLPRRFKLDHDRTPQGFVKRRASSTGNVLHSYKVHKLPTIEARIVLTTESLATATEASTDVGSYFVSNYPPYSQWKPEYCPEILTALDTVPDRSVPLGLYLHLPYCRKRCRFCYFRVYTNPNAAAIERYLQALSREAASIFKRPGLADRRLRYIYFGGGTPSFLSVEQLRGLHAALTKIRKWDQADEVSFECEPGTLTQSKVAALKEIGVTRISLGIENFNDAILEENGRAHLSPEILRAYDWIRQTGFDKVNVDLIAGMIGETDENWRQCLDHVRRLNPDSVTLYQMELPFNTLISREIREQGASSPIASWGTKRRWISEAFDELLAAGYHIATANELVRRPEFDISVYREHLFRGSDIIGLGVSSYGHFQGVHYQNFDAIDEYQLAVESDQLPIHRALRPTPHQRLIREFVLTMKSGRVSPAAFREKYNVDVLAEFAGPLAEHQRLGYLTSTETEIVLSRSGLLQVDGFLADYFEPQHRGIRYT